MPYDGSNWNRKPTNAQILISAAGVIEKYGHVKKDFGNTARGFCLYGAILHTADEDYVSANEAIEHLHNYLGVWPPDWNDEWYRTKGQVIRALESAAKKQKELENAL